jgi:DNA repair protein RecO (recombination protein O)
LDTIDLSSIHGFVLREIKFQETSKIIEVFTEELGRISIIARGVLKAKSKNLAITQRFVKAEYNLYKSGKDFYGIKDGLVLDSYSKSTRNFDIIIYKSAICDLLLRTIDHTQKGTVYKLLDRSFKAFEEGEKNFENIFFSFLLKYISFSGFKPNLATCGVSGKKIYDQDLYFSQSLSSVFLKEYKNQVKDRIYLRKSEFVYLKKLIYTSSDKLCLIEEDIDLRKMGKLIMDYCLEKLELRKFNSIEWIYKSIENRS